MKKPVDKLVKILLLEAERHQDRSVVGGLASYAETWAQEAKQEFGPTWSDWIDEVAVRLRTYSELPNVAARRKALASLYQVLKKGPVDSAPSLSRPTASPRQTSPRPKRAPGRQPKLDSPATKARGVGPKRSARLKRLGVRTIRDLLYFLPRRYEDYSQLVPINRLQLGEQVTIIAQVKKASLRRTRGGAPMLKAVLSDGTGAVEVTWFNQRYLANEITPGRQIVISGTVDEYLGHLCFTSPEWEPLRDELLHTNRIVPVYPLTEGLRAKSLRRLMKRTVTYWARRLPDHLPSSVQHGEGLLDLESAILQAHFPSSWELLQRARQRLAFDELFVLQLALLRQRVEWRSEPGQAIPLRENVLQSLVGSLPYDLTAAQRLVLEQIVKDVQTDRPMTRLLQGDVGSGKTVVATAALALAAAAGAQAALMAPTELLAEQHYRTIADLLERGLDVELEARLLTGSTPPAEREEITSRLVDGTLPIVVGTHALIQESVRFHNLVLAVVDEQHRFGVRQRAALRQKGYNPHLLVMTATPIPRSLQLTVWGHMDVSIIDEMPPGRKPVVTRLVLPSERERAYAFVRTQIEEGRQVFVICPLVEESDALEAKAAVDEFERLREDIFPDLKLGLLHGRMGATEKESTMASFVRGGLDLLVATSVIEVGIDVPNASVMLIEGAERFGLAQLHQFRGRVGRGEHESYCLLISDSASDQARERLEAMEATTDGFVLARKDLEMRGPGEFLGTRQSGFSEAVLSLELADVADLRLVQRAREAARRFFETDPQLADPAHRLLAQRVLRVLEQGGTTS